MEEDRGKSCSIPRAERTSGGGEGDLSISFAQCMSMVLEATAGLRALRDLIGMADGLMVCKCGMFS